MVDTYSDFCNCEKSWEIQTFMISYIVNPRFFIKDKIIFVYPIYILYLNNMISKPKKDVLLFIYLCILKNIHTFKYVKCRYY